MKRPELSDETKLVFLERLLCRLFGYNTKIDWQQDFIGSMSKIMLRDVSIDGEVLEMIDTLRLKEYGISIEARAYIENDPTFYPSPSIEGMTYRSIITENDIEIYEPDIDNILNDTPERIEEMKDGWMLRKRWEEKDSKREDHSYVDENLVGVYPESHRMATPKE